MKAAGMPAVQLERAIEDLSRSNLRVEIGGVQARP